MEKIKMAGEDFNAKVYKPNPDTIVVATGGKITRTRTRNFLAGAKVGGTAGFTFAHNDSGARCPASQTGAKLVVPITGLNIGDTITAFQVQAQIESAGGTVTLDADLRKLTNAAADPADASIGAITQVSVTADTKSEASKTLATAEVVAADETIYCLITVTTAASTDVQVLGVNVTINEDA